MFKKYSSLKLAISFIVLIALIATGYQVIGRIMVGNKKFSEIEPGKFTLLGVQTAADYKVIVSNSVARLVQGASKFESNMGEDSNDEGSDKHNIPMKDMVLSLQGNTASLSNLVVALNEDLRRVQKEIPPNPVIWKLEDIEKALHGDPVLQKKLVRDINCNLDGTPPDFISTRALYTGIVIEVSVPVRVRVGADNKTLIAKIQVPYRAGFTRKIERELTAKSVQPTDSETEGYYRAEQQDLIAHKGNREDIATALHVRVTPQLVKSYAEPAEQLLANAKVVLNGAFVKSASLAQNGTKDGKPIYDVTLHLTDEGRDRLWQYSLDKVGTQLLMIVNNVAIAAPRVRHQLAQSDITITQLTDLGLAQEAVDTINAASQAK